MKNVSSYIDLVFCVVVLPLMALIFPVERWFHNFPPFVISLGVWLYALYACNRLFTVPFLFGSRKEKTVGFLMILMSMVVTMGFSCANLYTPKPNIHDEGIYRFFPMIQQYQQAVWSLFMIVEAFSFAVGLLTQADLQRLRRREVEVERDKAEIQLYKAQIKPHFMFNTLNSLYGLVLTKSDKALLSLERFISMMRYVHQSSHRDFIPLAEEIDYINQYVGLQSLRLNEMTSVSLEVSVETENLIIPPMLLITFVENCFKHGVSSVEESKISIVLMERQGKILFSTSNHVFPVKRIGEHLGIENCRRRLDLLYPSRHTLDIAKVGDTFNVKLMIDLNND